MLFLIFTYSLLSDPVYAVRESASDALLRLVDRHPDIYGPRLEALVREGTEPEIRARAVRPLHAYYRWRANSFVPTGLPCYPICDAYPVQHPAVPFGLVDVRCKCTWPVETAYSDGKGGPTWVAYRRTTEQRVREMLWNGASHDEVRMLLERMMVVERRHKSDCGYDLPDGPWRGGCWRP